MSSSTIQIPASQAPNAKPLERLHLVPLIHVAVINESTLLSDADAEAALPALELQVTLDFSPHWGINAQLEWVSKGVQPPAGAWQLVLLDNSDQAGALGYHDVTAEGLPLGKVFVAADQQAGASVTVTMSHELLEMLADPEINLSVQTTNAQGGLRFIAYEVGDPVEDDQYGYLIGQTKVSDFVTPLYFTDAPPPVAKLDFGGFVKQPYAVLAGGYLSYLDATSAQGWQQVFGRLPRNLGPAFGPALANRDGGPSDPLRGTMVVAHRMFPVVGSRRERRRRPRHQWLRSRL